MKFININHSQQSKYVITGPEKITLFMYNFSGIVEVDIQAEGAEVNIFGLYSGRSAETFDIKTIQRHSKGKSTSNLLIKGVFFDEAKFAYEGLICIEPHAQQSNAYQKNQNLIMSDKAFVDSRPNLEIHANEVRCTHGSTTGRLNDDQLLYLSDRGIPQNEAEKLLIDGFMRDMFDKMSALVGRDAADKLHGDILSL